MTTLSQRWLVACGLGLLLMILPGCRKARREVAPPSAAQPRIFIESSKPGAAKTVPGEPRRAGETVLIEGATAAEVGLDFYPGAEVVKSTVTKSGADLTAGAELTTRDEYQTVVEFYRTRYKSPELQIKQSEVPGGKLTLFNWRDTQGNYTVGLKRDDAAKRTVITLAKVKAQRKRPAAKH